MSLEQELEHARAAAAGHDAAGRAPVAVLPAEPRPGARVYLAAFDDDGAVTYLAVDGAGRAVGDRRLLRDAVSMLALAERAEEVSGATAAEELESRFAAAAEALERAGMREAGQAAAAPPATPAYLDRIAGRAAELAAAVEALATHAERLAAAARADAVAAEAADAVWQAMAAVARAGDPGSFATALAASTGTVEALVTDVVEGYRGELG